MARTRLLKPGFFKNEGLADLRPPADCTTTPAASFAARLCYEGLWLLADRNGRLEDRPKRIKGEIFAYDVVDVEPLLQALADAGLIIRYTVHGERYLAIPTFLKHQSPHIKEPESRIPAPPRTRLKPDQSGAGTSLAAYVSPVPRSGTLDPVYGDGGDAEGVPAFSGTARARKSSAAGAAPPPLRVITKIAHEVMGNGLDAREWPEEIKRLCAQRHIAYDSESVRKAIESAEVQRRRAE